MVKDKQYLYIPGPTPVPPAVVTAMTKPVIGHRSSDFSDLYRGVVAKLKALYQTENDLFVLTNSGTGAMEMALANTINPGDKVLSLITGFFAERFARIAAACGAEVEFFLGGPIDLEQVEAKLGRTTRRPGDPQRDQRDCQRIAGLGSSCQNRCPPLYRRAPGWDRDQDRRIPAGHGGNFLKGLDVPPGYGHLRQPQGWERVEKCETPGSLSPGRLPEDRDQRPHPDAGVTLCTASMLPSI